MLGYDFLCRLPSELFKWCFFEQKLNLTLRKDYVQNNNMAKCSTLGLKEYFVMHKVRIVRSDSMTMHLILHHLLWLWSNSWKWHICFKIQLRFSTTISKMFCLNRITSLSATVKTIQTVLWIFNELRIVRFDQEVNSGMSNSNLTLICCYFVTAGKAYRIRFQVGSFLFYSWI